MKRSLVFLIVSLFFVRAFAQSAANNIPLSEVVAMALQKNYDVRIQQNSAALTSLAGQYSFGVFLPQINGTGSFVNNNNNSRTITASNVETEKKGVKSTNTNGSVQLVWTLFDGTKMFATRQRLTELAELGEVNLRNQMLNSVANVTTTYFNIVRQKQQLKATLELMSVNEERVKLAEKKLQVGIGSKPELLQAKVDLNAQRTAVLQQGALIQQLKDQLNGALGMALPDEFEVTDTIPINLGLSMDEVLTDIENTNQTLVASKKNISVAKLALREGRASRSPVINFTSAYNFGKTENATAVSAFSLLLNQNKGYNYGLTATIPILNGFNVTRTIRQAEITLEQQKLMYEQQKALAVVGIRNAYANYDYAKKALLIEEENILLAKENVLIALESFKRGIATYIELRTAQQSLSDTYSRLIAARYNAKTSETELLRLKGTLLKQQ